MTLVGGARHIVVMMLVAGASLGAACDRRPGGGTPPMSPRSTAAAPATPTASMPPPAAATAPTSTTPTTSPSSSPTDSTSTSPTTTVDLDLADVPIEDAFAEIAHQARVGVSLSSDVTGTVTIRVRAMPWDEAVALIARQQGLRVARTNVMLVVYKNAAPATDTFTGTPIEVRFEAAPIREVARVFAAHAKITIGVDDNVEVAVTQRMRNVPWDFALDHIARKYDLRVVRNGEALRISR